MNEEEKQQVPVTQSNQEHKTERHQDPVRQWIQTQGPSVTATTCEKSPGTPSENQIKDIEATFGKETTEGEVICI